MKELKAKREADEKRVTDELAKKAKAAKDAAVDVVEDAHEEYKDHPVVEEAESKWKMLSRHNKKMVAFGVVVLALMAWNAVFGM